MPPSFEVHTLDLQFQGAPHAIAAFLIFGPAGVVLIETGPGSTLGALQSELARLGVQPSDVADVLLTHIHLDHAGAAGWWAQHGARVHVHHLGAPHLIDPGRLLNSAQRIYGDAMDTLWGQFLPAPAHRVYALHDQAVVEAGGLRFIAHDTPGHARHHLVYQLDDLGFVGDLAGVRLPDHDHVRLPTPPPEFELEAWLDSAARMRALALSRIHLTHFGPVDSVAEHWDTVLDLVPRYAERVRAGLAAGVDRDALVTDMQAWEEARFVAGQVPEPLWPIYAGIGPASMSLDGVLRYWKKKGVA